MPRGNSLRLFRDFRCMISEPLEVCNVLNNYLTDIGSTLAEQLSESNTSFESYMPSKLPCTNSIFAQVECSEVVQEICSLQTKTNFGTKYFFM